ncbi:MAG: Membrane protein involved in the export of O-antigen and teichoic acid [Candidatus Methanocomedens sp.]|nr:MAG: Membrane protein involved in the export of O-antigen and teichoic acid [ANME-2 cluster archaeon]
MRLIKALKKNKLLKETSWSFVAKGIAFLLYFSLNVHLARTLGIDRFGTWSFFFSILTIIILLSHFGINASARKYVAQYNKTGELNNVLKSSLKLRLIFSLTFTIIIILVHKPLAILVERPEFAPLFLLSAPLIILAGLVEFLKDIFMGLHRIIYNFILNLLEHGLKLILVVTILTVSLDLSNIVNSFTIACLMTSVIGFYILYAKFYRENKTHVENDFVETIFRYSIPLFFISIGFLIATEVDTVMLGLLSTNAEVGTYAVAKQIIIKLPHISLAMAMGTMPVFAKLNEGNKEKLKKLFYKLLRTNALIFAIIALGILFLSRFFVPLIFGVEYNSSVLPLQILTIYLVGFSFSIFLSTFLDYQGLAKKRAVNLSVSMVLNIVLNLILIPDYGAVGAAIATSISYLPYIFLNWIEVRGVLKV